MTSRRKSVTINSKSGLAGPKRRNAQAVNANSQGQNPQSENSEALPPAVAEPVIERVSEVPAESKGRSVEGPKNSKDVPSHVDELIGEINDVRPVSALCAFLYRPLYKSLFYVSFGAVYGALFVNRLLPEEGAVAKGLRDGGRAAHSAYVKRMQERNDAMSALRDAKA